MVSARSASRTQGARSTNLPTVYNFHTHLCTQTDAEQNAGCKQDKAKTVTNTEPWRTEISLRGCFEPGIHN